MRVAVLGAGVIGVSTAYFLAKAGAKVTVLEREPMAAMQCSYANGAQLSYSHADQLASYANVLKALKWIGRKDAPLLLRSRLDPDMYTWLIKFLGNCSQSNTEKNIKAILGLNFYSRKVLHDVLKVEKLDFDYSTSGILHIFKHKAELDACEKFFANLSKLEASLSFERFSAAGCVEHDRALEHLMLRRAGGLFCSADELGDTYKFSHALEKICRKLGVEFSYNTEVLGLEHGRPSHITSVILDEHNIEVDAVVVCMGAYGSIFLREHGINLPVYPLKGYSISVPTDNSYICPKVSVTDQQRKVVFSRIGDVFRIGGTAEFAGFNHEISPERIAPILNAAKRYFPNACDYQLKSTWACLRPQTPRSYPFISKAKFNNLYVNIGHGMLGWTQALGSAKVVTDLLMHKRTELDIEPYRFTYTK